MSAPLWTPGPWLRDGSAIYALDESGSCNRFSVHVEGGWTFRSAGSIGASGDRTSEQELDAIRTLIGAAPDLYEALEKIVESGVSIGGHHRALARAALSKANPPNNDEQIGDR